MPAPTAISVSKPQTFDDVQAYACGLRDLHKRRLMTYRGPCRRVPKFSQALHIRFLVRRSPPCTRTPASKHAESHGGSKTVNCHDALVLKHKKPLGTLRQKSIKTCSCHEDHFPDRQCTQERMMTMMMMVVMMMMMIIIVIMIMTPPPPIPPSRSIAGTTPPRSPSRPKRAPHHNTGGGEGRHHPNPEPCRTTGRGRRHPQAKPTLNTDDNKI